MRAFTKDTVTIDYVFICFLRRKISKRTNLSSSALLSPGDRFAPRCAHCRKFAASTLVRPAITPYLNHERLPRGHWPSATPRLPGDGSIGLSDEQAKESRFFLQIDAARTQSQLSARVCLTIWPLIAPRERAVVEALSQAAAAAPFASAKARPSPMFPASGEADECHTPSPRVWMVGPTPMQCASAAALSAQVGRVRNVFAAGGRTEASQSSMRAASASAVSSSK